MLTSDFQITWEASLLNYTHKTPNVLTLKSCRERYHLFGPDFVNLPARADPMDFAEWADLCNDEEALAMDRDFAAVFTEFAGPDCEEPVPPPAPAGPPPGRVLPPRPPRIALPRLPPDAIMVQGAAIYNAGAARPIGRQSFMVHWYPPSASMRCLHPDHHGCALTADLTEDAIAALRNWVAHANDFPDADSHRSAAPDGVREREP